MAREIAVMTSMGKFTVELYSDHAPMACANFATLAQTGYYDRVAFHRVVANFMIQGGDPSETGQGGQSIYMAPFRDEITTALRHTGAGILSMANTGPNTNRSQFFITLAPAPWLDGRHTIFGRVTSGMRVIRSLGMMETDKHDCPTQRLEVMQMWEVESAFSPDENEEEAEAPLAEIKPGQMRKRYQGKRKFGEA